MSPHQAGLLFSTIFHLALIFTLFVNFTFDSPVLVKEQELSLSLQMFAVQTEKEPEVTQVETLQQAAAKELPVEVVETVPQHKEVTIEPPVQEKQVIGKDFQEKQLEQQSSKPEPMAETEEAMADNDMTYLRLLEEQYADKVKKSIEAHKFYPSRARRRALEGDVVIAFTVSRVGHVNNIRVVRSSSVRSLDRAAINAVNRVGSFEPFPDEIPREWWEFEIALSYHLL